MLSKRSFKIRSSLFFKWAIHYFRLLNTVDSKYIKIADDWSRTVDLWCWKRPLNQLCQNNSPRFTLFLFYFWQNYERKCYRAYFSISQSVSVKTDWNLNFRMNRRAPSQSGNRQQRLKTHKNVFCVSKSTSMTTTIIVERKFVKNANFWFWTRGFIVNRLRAFFLARFVSAPERQKGRTNHAQLCKTIFLHYGCCFRNDELSLPRSL